MADFLNLTETQLISFAQNFAVKLAVHDLVLTTIAAANVTQPPRTPPTWPTR